MLASLLFMGTVVLSARIEGAVALRGAAAKPFGRRRELNTAIFGALFAALLVMVVGGLTLDARAVWTLSLLAVVISIYLTGSGWLLALLLVRLPTPRHRPLWTLAIQGLARHLLTTAVLALSADRRGLWRRSRRTDAAFHGDGRNLRHVGGGHGSARQCGAGLNRCRTGCVGASP